MLDHSRERGVESDVPGRTLGAAMTWQHHGRPVAGGPARTVSVAAACQQPAFIELTLDTMVMDNDEAQQRQGATPTYKKVKGFQPLHLLWQERVVDAIFRPGHVHSNAGSTPRKLVADVVHLIRRRCRAEVPILLRIDAGFFDQENFTFYDEELRIGFIAPDLSGLAGVKEKAAAAPGPGSGLKEHVWDWTVRAWYAGRGGKISDPPQTARRQGGVKPAGFARSENVIVTNLAGSKVLTLSARHGHGMAETQGLWRITGSGRLPHQG